MIEIKRVTQETTVDGVKAIRTTMTYKFSDGSTGEGRSEEVVQRNGSSVRNDRIALADGTKLESVRRMGSRGGTVSSVLTTANGTIFRTNTQLDRKGRIVRSESTWPKGTTLQTDYTYDTAGRLTGYKYITKEGKNNETRGVMRFNPPVQIYDFAGRITGI
ncbi:MAG: hypothetical protein IPP68_12075 [Elusimicrobia bacterium]|nr:hypothetical protein [Elusimicrobiota bacterium]